MTLNSSTTRVLWHVYKDNGAVFQKVMKILVIGLGFVIPIIFSYWQYQNRYEPTTLFDATVWAITGTPFSCGLWMSVSRLGRRLKYLTLLMLLIGMPFHIMFSIYPVFFLVIVVIIEIYAVYLLFKKDIA